MTSIRISTRQRKLIGSSSLIAILVLFIIVQRGCNSPKKTPVTPPLSGTFTVTGTPEPLVIAAIQDGEVKITNVETEENYDLELLDGEPRPLPLAPGSYRINNSGEVQFEFQNPEFTIVSGKTLTHPLFILLPFSWKHPKLPTIAGATATWKGELTRKPSNQPVVTADISTKSGSKKEKTATSKSPPGEDPRATKIEPAVQRAVTFNYQLIMTTMNEDVVDDVKCRWLHVEVESFSSLNPMPVTEEAYWAVAKLALTS